MGLRVRWHDGGAVCVCVCVKAAIPFMLSSTFLLSYEFCNNHDFRVIRLGLRTP